MIRTKKRNLFHSLILALLVVPFTLILLEVCGFLFLKGRPEGSPYSFLFESKKLSPPRQVYLFSLTDPLLGWGTQPPFKEYTSDQFVPSETISGPVKKIIVLGGSTTDPAVERYNWAYYLAQFCAKNKIRCEVLNGGVSGYNSTQEFLKLVRDVAPLKPDLVISLNGVNDATSSVPHGRTFINAQQSKIEEGLRINAMNSFFVAPTNIAGVFPNLQFLVKFFSQRLGLHEPPTNEFGVGTRDNFSNGQRWEYNVRMMHAIAKEFKFKYFVFLQPHLANNIDLAKRKMESMGTSLSPQYDAVKNFYQIARNSCKSMTYCADISDDFTGDSNNFLDLVHLPPKGHAKQAEKIFSHLKQRGLL